MSGSWTVESLAWYFSSWSSFNHGQLKLFYMMFNDWNKNKMANSCMHLRIIIWWIFFFLDRVYHTHTQMTAFTWWQVLGECLFSSCPRRPLPPCRWDLAPWTAWPWSCRVPPSRPAVCSAPPRCLLSSLHATRSPSHDLRQTLLTKPGKKDGKSLEPSLLILQSQTTNYSRHFLPWQQRRPWECPRNSGPRESAQCIGEEPNWQTDPRSWNKGKRRFCFDFMYRLSLVPLASLESTLYWVD